MKKTLDGFPNSYIIEREFFSKKTFNIQDKFGGISKDFFKQTPIEAIKWASVKTIYGKILNIEEGKVTIKCLLNEEDRYFQVRKFEGEPFRGSVNLEVNQFVEIKIFTRSGERKFTYKNAPRRDLEEIFEPKNYFEGLDNSPFFNSLSSFQDENND